MPLRLLLELFLGLYLTSEISLALRLLLGLRLCGAVQISCSLRIYHGMDRPIILLFDRLGFLGS